MFRALCATQPSCARPRSRVPSLSGFLAYVESLTPSLPSCSFISLFFLLSGGFFNYYLFRVQVIGALAGLTDALEEDVKAGLRTDSRRCAPFYSFPPAKKCVRCAPLRQHATTDWSGPLVFLPDPPARKTSTRLLLAGPRSGTPSTSRTPSSCTTNSRRITRTSSVSLPPPSLS